LFLLTCALTSSAAAADDMPRASQQLVLVVTPDWNATQGEMRTFDRHDGRWQSRGKPTSVSIGRAGSAWGIGLHQPQPGVQKREGDGRSPAGMFTIGTGFGYADRVASKLAYRGMTQFDYCMDVNDSPLYNRIVDAREVGEAAVAKSTEPMRLDLRKQGDERYRLGFVIEHNPKNEATRGSCIFAHLWGSPGQATAGCTAMTDAAMRDLIAWLDEDLRPLFVLLPRTEYARLEESWGLPELGATR
jgi:L,D-peptidoglycan transpeptidase YkuD (ErfK/YbiS/YcfS/YnhG family)